jgi:hypothetical protein
MLHSSHILTYSTHSDRIQRLRLWTFLKLSRQFQHVETELSTGSPDMPDRVMCRLKGHSVDLVVARDTVPLCNDVSTFWYDPQQTHANPCGLLMMKKDFRELLKCIFFLIPD